MEVVLALTLLTLQGATPASLPSIPADLESTPSLQPVVDDPNLETSGPVALLIENGALTEDVFDVPEDTSTHTRRERHSVKPHVFDNKDVETQDLGSLYELSVEDSDDIELKYRVAQILKEVQHRKVNRLRNRLNKNKNKDTNYNKEKHKETVNTEEVGEELHDSDFIYVPDTGNMKKITNHKNDNNAVIENNNFGTYDVDESEGIDILEIGGEINYNSQDYKDFINLNERDVKKDNNKKDTIKIEKSVDDDPKKIIDLVDRQKEAMKDSSHHKSIKQHNKGHKFNELLQHGEKNDSVVNDNTDYHYQGTKNKHDDREDNSDVIKHRHHHHSNENQHDDSGTSNTPKDLKDRNIQSELNHHSKRLNEKIHKKHKHDLEETGADENRNDSNEINDVNTLQGLGFNDVSNDISFNDLSKEMKLELDLDSLKENRFGDNDISLEGDRTGLKSHESEVHEEDYYLDDVTNHHKINYAKTPNENILKETVNQEHSNDYPKVNSKDYLKEENNDKTHQKVGNDDNENDNGKLQKPLESSTQLSDDIYRNLETKARTNHRNDFAYHQVHESNSRDESDHGNDLEKCKSSIASGKQGNIYKLSFVFRK